MHCMPMVLADVALGRQAIYVFANMVCIVFVLHTWVTQTQCCMQMLLSFKRVR